MVADPPQPAKTTESTGAIDLRRIPPEIIAACRHLRERGFGAYLVGGAVRDLLRSPTAAAKDFDLTTSARPEQVIEIFGQRRTIPTGIEHGTVTVMCDSGQTPGSPRPVEITTFRGEVGFSDGRRPDRVEFITDLTEDLRRRDFTINAIAYDPLLAELIDPFGGQADLRRRVLRAVGDPAARFAEDGLRVMRAVRFAAQLEFAVDPPTRQAFAGALSTLRKVSRERVREELLKLLAAPRPARALRLLVERSDHEPTADWGEHGCLLNVILPEVAAMLVTPPPAMQWWWLVELAPPSARLAALLWPLRRYLSGPGSLIPKTPGALAELLDERLKLPVRQRQQLCVLLLPEPAAAPAASPDFATAADPLHSDAAVRRLLAQTPFELLEQKLQLQGLESLLAGELGRGDTLFRLRDRLHTEHARNPPLSTAELAISGKDLIVELGLRPGPQIGILLSRLLDSVLEDPQRNERPALLDLARQLHAQPAPG